jgi:hypothetical protein
MKKYFLNSKPEIREGNISLVLDSYQDIFSDFDPRPYKYRALSDDFLSECKRASRDKGEEGIELRLLVPKEQRNLKEEEIIRERLKEHFKKHSIEKYDEMRSVQREGIFWFILGALIMSVDTVLVGYVTKNFFVNFLIVILEPAGWFTFWEGLGKVFIHSKEKLPDYEFYKKMYSSEVDFFNY